MEQLRVRHLRLLELVGSRGSLTAAATELRIGQPAASKLLQDLEAAFGHSLVDRSVHGGRLSAAGERALERLRIATASLDAIADAMDVDAEAPLVRIGMLPLAGVSLVPRLVARLVARHELPRMRLREGQVAEVLGLLDEGTIDCVIGRVGPEVGERGADAYDILPLSDEHFEVACGPAHPLARKRRLPLSQLVDQAWILPPRGTYTRAVFDAAFSALGLRPPHACIESASFHMSLATVCDTALVTFAPRAAVGFYVSLGRVQKVSLATPFRADFVAFITRKDPVVLPAVELIRRELQRMTA